jgi:hypothetical protein
MANTNKNGEGAAEDDDTKISGVETSTTNRRHPNIDQHRLTAAVSMDYFGLKTKVFNF